MTLIHRNKHWQSYTSLKAEILDTAYKTHPIDLQVREVILDALVSSVPKHSRILDIGCGTGDITFKIYDEGYSVTGLDISNGMLEVFKKNAGERDVPVIIGDIFELPPSKVKFDAAIARYVFSHYSDFGSLILNISNHIKDEGIIIFDSFSEESLEISSSILEIEKENIANNVFKNLSYFSEEDLNIFCNKYGFTLIKRYSSSLFHRNPSFAGLFQDISKYDSELSYHMNKKPVREFVEWLQLAVSKSSKLSGVVINIIQKKKS